MKKILLSLLIILPIYLLINLYFLDKDYFLCPIDSQRGIVVRCDSRGEGFFGADRNGRRTHQGIDLLAEIDTPVLASRSGWVIAATRNKGMGNYVIIRHAGNLISIYGHLSRIYAAKNDFVRQGQIIGSVGKTGNANFLDIHPHLHFEVRKNGIPQDPVDYID